MSRAGIQFTCRENSARKGVLPHFLKRIFETERTRTGPFKKLYLKNKSREVCEIKIWGRGALHGHLMLVVAEGKQAIDDCTLYSSIILHMPLDNRRIKRILSNKRIFAVKY
jgi:hypothetical protein